MNFHIFKYIIIIILLIVFIGAFSISYTSHSIDNLAYVIAIGIDVGSTKDNLKITFQFADSSNFSSNGSPSEGPATIINSVESSSIDTAINLMNSYVGKELNLAHCKVIVFSEEVCTGRHF